MGQLQGISKLKESSIYFKLCCVFVVAGFVVDLIGFASPYWQRIDQHYSGLWRTCNKYDYCQSYNHIAIDGWFQASRSFAALGLVFGTNTLTLLLLFLFVPVFGTKTIIRASSISCFTAGCCIYLGVLLFASHAKPHKGWAWVLCVMAVPIYNAAGTILLKEWKTNSRNKIGHMPDRPSVRP